MNTLLVQALGARDLTIINQQIEIDQLQARIDHLVREIEQRLMVTKPAQSVKSVKGKR